MVNLQALWQKSIQDGGRVARRRFLGVSTALLCCATSASAVDGVWNSTTGGVALPYSNSGNWQSGVVASGVGATADFNSLDLANNVNVDVDAPVTLGHIVFGDTNLTSAGIWNFLSQNASAVTLDGGGSTPTITANELTPTVLDSVLFQVGLEGTQGFSKLGAGVLALASDQGGLTGTISLDEGTLRIMGADAGLNVAAAANVPAISIADGALLDMGVGAPDLSDASVKAGANVTIQSNDNMQMFNVQAEGAGATINLNSQGGLNRLFGDWGGATPFAAVNFVTGQHRLRLSSGFNPDSFASTDVSLGDGANLNIRTNSTGNDIRLGSLAGDANSSFSGSANNGGAARYEIGGIGGAAEFAGVVDGGGRISINKVGAGTQTFSGSFANFAGRAIRVSEGTMAFTNTATTITGGADVTSQTSVNVLGGAVWDVSGTNSAFTTEANTKIIGSGSIVTTGAGFNHAGGSINPGDVDPSASPSNGSTPTAGAITFDGGLTFNGGSIAFDMGETPGADDLIQVIGATSVSGGGVIDPNFLGAAPAPGLTYTVLSGSAGFDVGDGVLGSWAVNWPGRGAKPQVFVDGFDLKFTTTSVGAGGDVIWTGATNGVWDVETTQNWSLGGSADTFFQGDNVAFNDSGANPAITVDAVVNPGDMVVDSDANNYSFTGNSILASGALTKRGASTLTFGLLNQFSGVTVEGGAIDTSGAIGTLGTGQLTLAGGSVVNIGGGGSLANSSIEIAAGTVNTLSYTGVSGAGSSATRPLLGGLTGAGEVSVVLNTGGSWLDLRDTSGFDGTLNIGPDGTNAVSLGLVRIYGGQTDFGGVELNLSSLTMASRQGGEDVGSFTYEIGALNGDASTTLLSKTGGGDTDTIWQIGDLNTDSVFEGVIIDDDPSTPSALSHVVKVGTGTLTLAGPNSYTGDTTVEEGTLSVTNAFFADTADIFVATAALLDLAHSDTDVIDSLYFASAPQAIGTYGRTGLAGVDFNVPWITGDGILSVTTLGAVLPNPGDFNGDGVVDAADYTVWRDGGGSAAEYDEWRDNYGATYPLPASGVTAAPEPASVVLLVLSSLAAFGRRRWADN